MDDRAIIFTNSKLVLGIPSIDSNKPAILQWIWLCKYSAVAELENQLVYAIGNFSFRLLSLFEMFIPIPTTVCVTLPFDADSTRIPETLPNFSP